MGGAEGLDLGLGEVAGADDEAGAAGELQEDWEEIHGPSSIIVFGKGLRAVLLHGSDRRGAGSMYLNL